MGRPLPWPLSLVGSLRAACIDLGLGGGLPCPSVADETLLFRIWHLPTLPCGCCNFPFPYIPTFLLPCPPVADVTFLFCISHLFIYLPPFYRSVLPPYLPLKLPSFSPPSFPPSVLPSSPSFLPTFAPPLLLHAAPATAVSLFRLIHLRLSGSDALEWEGRSPGPCH